VWDTDSNGPFLRFRAVGSIPISHGSHGSKMSSPSAYPTIPGMDTCILQLDCRIFRLVHFRVGPAGDIESVELGRERVEIGDCIRETGSIGRRAWIHGVAVVGDLVNLARSRLPHAHLVVVTSETVSGALNAEGFFEALRRHTGVESQRLLPSDVLALVTRSSVWGSEDETASSTTRSPDPFRASGPRISRTKSSLPCPS
jgi:hypothetical protein